MMPDATEAFTALAAAGEPPIPPGCRVVERSFTLYAGAEEEIDARLIGKFFRRQPAYTYPGEYAPTDPPEPASFEIEAIHVHRGGIWRVFPLWLLTAEQEAELADGAAHQIEAEEW